MSSLIGKDLTILGDTITIISANRLRGLKVAFTAMLLATKIGPEGSVTGTVLAEMIEILGGVRGSIHCTAAELHDTAHVDAEIVHESLVMENGAYVNGQVRQLRNRSELIAKLDPNSYVQNGQ